MFTLLGIQSRLFSIQTIKVIIKIKIHKLLGYESRKLFKNIFIKGTSYIKESHSLFLNSFLNSFVIFRIAIDAAHSVLLLINTKICDATRY